MINSVRNTVLSVLNKNNYGYISPSDFNLYAKQAQMEFYDEYFSNYNKIVNMENARMSNVDYADMRKKAEENMEFFMVTKFLHHSHLNKFYIPSLTTTGDEAYMINRVMYHYNQLLSGTNSAIAIGKLIDAAATFTSSGISVGDFVLNKATSESAEIIAIDSGTQLTISDSIFTAPATAYSIVDAEDAEIAEKVSNSRITMLNQSLLTSPSEMFPAYSQDDGRVVLYPKTANEYGAVVANYFRYPKDPKWTYILISGGEPMFDQSQPDYQDFELPLEDEYKLVVKILQYCGISIREADVSNFAMFQEQHEQPSFSQKQ
ncbi:MAG: structural protein [Podoviridae sp. ctrTa16]|nr:MAG: structural protein [Podoviridae sp. ctrTa16]